jgi:hypothetical protein
VYVFRCSTPLVELAALIDGLSRLSRLAVRGNPLMKTTRHARVTLLSYIKSLRSHHCVLRVIDTPISVDERINAWIANGETVEAAEAFRAEFTLMERTPTNCEGSPASVTLLNLSSANLLFVDLSPYLNLERLRCAACTGAAVVASPLRLAGDLNEAGCGCI